MCYKASEALMQLHAQTWEFATYVEKNLFVISFHTALYSFDTVGIYAQLSLLAPWLQAKVQQENERAFTSEYDTSWMHQPLPALRICHPY